MSKIKSKKPRARVVRLTDSSVRRSREAFTPAIGPWLVTGICLLAVMLQAEQIQVQLSWGHQAPTARPFYIKLLTNDVSVADPIPQAFESEDKSEADALSTRAGGGDVDALEFTLQYPDKPVNVITNLQRIWVDLIAQSDPDTVRRLQNDPAYRPDSRKLTVQLDREGTKGFSLTVDQLLRTKTFWVPSLDLYVSAGEPPVSFAQHQQELAQWKGKRVLQQVELGPEASYAQFTARWEDMGNPSYKNPGQTGPGHMVGLTWDSALYKFGIDRGAGIWNDYGNPDRFRVWFDVGELGPGLASVWKGQHLSDGLPVMTTVLERDGLRHEIEQFAYPLNGTPKQREGDIPMVLLQKLILTNLTDHPVSASVRIRQRRLGPEAAQWKLEQDQGSFWLEEAGGRGVLLAINAVRGTQMDLRDLPEDKQVKPDKSGRVWKGAEVVVTLELPARGAESVIVKLPSPILPRPELAKLLAMEYGSARERTLAFWTEYLERGARFRVPDAAVNDLFRANLWHALRLPRRHTGPDGAVKLDLPYSNFAYDQKGTPWPVNQAVYVDYMIYDLRGYHAIAAEELEAIYANNQEPSGHLGGIANWVVYTPGMIYSVAKNYLLSGDRAAFDRLLPQTLRALDWCLGEIRKNADRPGPSSGLVRGPLNDLTGEGVWAFNQAYIYAGLELLGRALSQIGHERAQVCVEAAAGFRQCVERGFGAASMRSPLVQLRDHTWIPYVPCEALTPHRLFQQWYPTDVDTGATHLPRLNALAPEGSLTDSLLEDHEDNLYLRGWGMANEPVYNQQATAYLERDNPKAAVRAFYSMLACAFSQSAFEPVEHRWTWGQYFGPPSTDGAWFELYRQMLIRELDDDTLFLLQAAPRPWWADGQSIQVDQAPTYYGPLVLNTRSQAASGRLVAEFDLPNRKRPKTVLVRFRHPESRLIQKVTVNGQNWTDFDRAKEWVRIANPDRSHYAIVCEYER